MLVKSGDCESLAFAVGEEKDIDCKTCAMSEAAHLNKIDCVQVLLEAGVHPTSQYGGRTPLYWAVRANSIPIIKLMLDKCASDLKLISDPKHRLIKKIKMTKDIALYEAAAHGQTDSVNTLLEHGVDPNLFAYHDHAAVSWSTPLIAACYAYMGQRDSLQKYCNTAKVHVLSVPDNYIYPRLKAPCFSNYKMLAARGILLVILM